MFRHHLIKRGCQQTPFLCVLFAATYEEDYIHVTNSFCNCVSTDIPSVSTIVLNFNLNCFSCRFFILMLFLREIKRAVFCGVLKNQMFVYSEGTPVMHLLNLLASARKLLRNWLQGTQINLLISRWHFQCVIVLLYWIPPASVENDSSKNVTCWPFIDENVPFLWQAKATKRSS